MSNRNFSASHLIASLAIVAVAGCGGSSSEGSSMKIGGGSASMTIDKDIDATIVLDGEQLTFGYVANCTISPMISGVVLYERRPDYESSEQLSSLTVKTFTQDDQTEAEVNVSDDGFYYQYIGGAYKEGETLRWSGAFKKYAQDNPTQQIDEVEGSGTVTC